MRWLTMCHALSSIRNALLIACDDVPPLESNPDVPPGCDNPPITQDMLDVEMGQCTNIPSGFCETNPCGCEAWLAGGYPTSPSQPAPPVVVIEPETPGGSWL